MQDNSKYDSLRIELQKGIDSGTYLNFDRDKFLQELKEKYVTEEKNKQKENGQIHKAR